MTDHLEAARDRLGGLHGHLSRREAALAADDLHAILSAILDHLEAEQASPEPDVLPEPEPEPDPLDETNHDDRYDRDGDRWVWCDKCCGFRTVHYPGPCCPGEGWTVAGVNNLYGPLTFTHRPTDTPTTAPRSEQAHGDADEPARPKLNVQTMPCVTLWAPAGTHAWSIRPDYADQLRADAWDEGHRTGRQDERNACHYGDQPTPNPYRKDRA